MNFKRFSLARRVFVAVLILGTILGTFGTVYAQDSDGDGVPDDEDFCPFDGDLGAGIDAEGCPFEVEGAGGGDTDADGDGFSDEFDICPNRGDEGFGVDPSGCPFPAPGEEDNATNNQNQNQSGLVATQRCTPRGLVAIVTNNGAGGEFELTVSTASGETFFETLTLDTGASERTPAFQESFAIFVGVDLLIEADINNCTGTGGAGPGGGAGDTDDEAQDFDGAPAGNATVATSVSCTADGVVVTFTNNTLQTIPSGQVEIVQEAVIDGSRATDSLPELAPGQSVSLRPSNESFRVFVNGELATTADVNNCGEGQAAPLAEVNANDIGTSVSCTANGVVVTFTNNTAQTIPGGQVEIVQEAVADGSRATDALPELAPNQSVSLRPSNESFRVFVNGELATTADVNACGDAAQPAAQTGNNSVSTDVQCTADGVVVTFTNNSDTTIPGNQVTVVQEALRDGSRASDVLPELAPGQSVSLRPSNESYRVYVNGALTATADVNACNTAAQTNNEVPAEGDFLTLINAERARNGAGPVSYNDQLTTAAQRHSQDMVDRNYFEHDAPAPAPYGATIGERVTAAGFDWTGVAENIAGSQTTEAAVFQAWMNSPGHRTNMLEPSYTQIGLGRVGNTWTLVLATGTSGNAGADAGNVGADAGNAGDTIEAGNTADANVQPRITYGTECVQGGILMTLSNVGNGATQAVPVQLVSASGTRISDTLPVIQPGGSINLPVQSESFSFFVRGELLVNVDASVCQNGGGVAVEQPADLPANANPPAENEADNGVAVASGTEEFLRLLNEERQRNGLGPVSYNTNLNTAAQRHSQDMVNRNYFSHNAPAPAPHGVSFGERIRATGHSYMAAAENITRGDSAAAAFRSWMNSQGHRENMLNGRYTQIGLGRVGNTWTLVLTD